ncbi:DEAD/DEAH box helicase [Aquabacterium sp.]|uniref:DEAD/DEAH box helicase n=1 Tax=Aquabacterium sp. TaxID=1872578 RepID=UPI002BD88D22|nr:DEAD/DEAH box helicase [Aquabacterium sp.]HSW03712.1 DEAD/DEAH box helicase [Aquabacterium sp.]
MSFDSQDEALLAAPAATTPTGPSFDSLGVAPEILKAITHAGYPTPTDVQALAVPAALTGRDLQVSAKTGSGKTAAFVWPALQRILDARNDPAKKRAKGGPSGPRILVLAPTRELAQQVSRAFVVYGGGVQGLRIAHVVGGVPYHAQLKALRGPLDVLIATPGRLLDLMNSGSAIMSQVEMLVLDEADRMLDMGFIDDITTIAQALPQERQTLMFSATFAGTVGKLASDLTRDPQRINVASHTDTHAQIEQRLHWADSLHHKHALLEQLLADRDVDQAVVFTSTQRDADALAWKLGEIGHSVAALHGGMPQGRRNRVLQDLRHRQLRVLVATDVASRGIDVPTITHVINYGLPMKAEDYVHRIGRTGRAGRTGLAITLAERRDVGMIRRIERFTTQRITASVVAGLEPKMPAPSDTKPSSERSFGKPAGKSFGAPRKPGFGGPGKSRGGPREFGAGKPSGPRRGGFER